MSLEVTETPIAGRYQGVLQHICRPCTICRRQQIVPTLAAHFVAFNAHIVAWRQKVPHTSLYLNS